jgi:hypothetical protein
MEDTKNICGLKKHMNKIFICVPTMNDFEFLSTIERAYDYSENPDNLSIATIIFWKPQDIKSNSKPFFTHIKKYLDKNFTKVKYDIQPWHLYPGVGQGRIAPTKFFNNEKYFLSIDSHTDFINNWDTEIIELYESSRKYFGKLRVLTTYLSSYHSNSTIKNNSIKNTKKTLRPEDLTNRWAFFDFYKNLGAGIKNNELIFPLPNDRLITEEDLKYFSSNFIDNKFLPAKKISAHCYFTESNPWLTKYNLNLDKDINFWGEEFYQSSLSYARGYNLVWFNKQIMFHQYENLNKNGREYKESYLKNFKNTEEKSKIFKKFIEGSQVLENTKINIKNNDNEIVYKLFDKNINNNETMPRSIKGFLEYEGIDFINRKTSPWWKVPDLNVIYP